MKIKKTMLRTAVIGCGISVICNLLAPGESAWNLWYLAIYFPFGFLIIGYYLKFSHIKDYAWVNTVIFSPMWLPMLICMIDLIAGTYIFMIYAVRSIPFAITASIVIMEYQFYKINNKNTRTPIPTSKYEIAPEEIKTQNSRLYGTKKKGNGMKIAIWIGSCFIYGIIMALLQQFGITLGGIPTFILASITFFVAHKLCKMWDRHQGVYEVSDDEEYDTGEETDTIYDKPLEWYDETKEWIEKQSSPIPVSHPRSSEPSAQNTKSTTYKSYLDEAELVAEAKKIGLTLEELKAEAERMSVSPGTALLLMQKEYALRQEMKKQECTLYCRKCGIRLLPDSLFCNKCGTKVASYEDKKSKPKVKKSESFVEYETFEINWDD